MGTFRFAPSWHEVASTWGPLTQPDAATFVELFHQHQRSAEQYMPGAPDQYTPGTSGATVTLGTDGSIIGYWAQSGFKRIRLSVHLALGVGGSLAGGPLVVAFPLGIDARDGLFQVGSALAFDTSAATYAVGVVQAIPAQGFAFRLVKNAGGIVGVGGTDPFTWAAGDSLDFDIDMFIA